MSDNQIDTKSKQKEVKLEEGTYEIIRSRLRDRGNELTNRIDLLNQARKDVFGSIETKLIGTDRITTEHNCIATDMVSINSTMLFGYNVTIGLKSKVSVSDVFSVYSFHDLKFTQKNLDLINSEQFYSDFDNLYEFYKNTQFVKFAIIGPHLFMVFQTGKSTDDIKVFKWLIKNKKLEYKGNRSTHEFVFPDQHEFKWKKSTRESYHLGEHPHVSIEDIVFVETVGGDLTIKVENNTNTGLGIYAEEVDNPNQTLDDAEIYYAIIGNIVVLKILPYQEKNFRYIIYNSKVQEAIRVDTLENSCILLPDNQGLIFANGYYLQTGLYKIFENGISNLLFEYKQASANGEDFLYVFYNKETGTYVLLIYNLISQKIETPIICNGFSIFDNGDLCYFKGDKEEKKHHSAQIWQTPFMLSDMLVPEENDTFLFKIGNKDIVKAMAECNELLLLINKDDSYNNLYVDIVKRSTDIIDSYHWLNHKESHNLIEPLKEIRTSANSAISEYEKVSNLKKDTGNKVSATEEKVTEIFRHISKQKFDNIDRYVSVLDALRNVRGEIISLKDLRYVNTSLVEEMENNVAEKSLKISQYCVDFLLRENSLVPYEKKVFEIDNSIEKITKVKEAEEVGENILKVSNQLEMLIDIVSNLKIEDATQTTQIINNISAIYSGFNQIKARLKKKQQGLHSVEAKAEFNSQIKLIEQGVVNYLDLCDTPEKTDEYLSKLMVQLEEIEGKFSDFDEFIEKASQKREEVYNAFESKKANLVELRNRRTNTLLSSADRILKAIQSRISKLADTNEINGYFASDLMIEKVRDVITNLKELDDNVKADDLESRLKTIREEAIRQIKDRNELFVDGENIIRFGNHKFSVNAQPLELSMVYKNEKMYFHLSGTNFFETVKDEAFLNTKDVWNQTLVSENNDVYRSEYLAYQLYKTAKQSKSQESPNLNQLAEMSDNDLLTHIQKFMSTRYSEGYNKGLHDIDTLTVLKQCLTIYKDADLLIYESDARACAEFFWEHYIDKDLKQELNLTLKGAGIIHEIFPDTSEFDKTISHLQSLIQDFTEKTQIFSQRLSYESAEYLFYEIGRGDKFILSQEAEKIRKEFNSHLKKNRIQKRFEDSTIPLAKNKLSTFTLVKSWLSAFINSSEINLDNRYISECTLTYLAKPEQTKNLVKNTVKATLENMKGTHRLLDDNKYPFHFNEFMKRLFNFEKYTVANYESYTHLRKKLLSDFTSELRLNEFKPRVMSSFVRNKLIDKVYLPLIGNNLAKQIGAEGEGKRTDLMGMLLLISPPGYGKTTLMEYLANRLGIIFMKINGPSIGHSITSLDPAEAGNAAAREELQKLNLAFEMGDNVMIYLDDIQHCNPEFLQKFISLCDAQRKIEGVYKGKSKTYDFRGKKVCVVMAGNPYTESGDKFKIPDMLSNRADIYNIGDIIGSTAEEFKLSYIENSLTSNPVLNKIASKSPKDLYTLIQIATTNSKEGIDFEYSHTPDEVNEYVNVLKKMIEVRDIILKVNSQYIESAAQADDYRTEPPFKLQGSYRDMNKISEKVLPIMNDEEIKTLIMSHYQNEAQTLTTGAEANILKFKDLYGTITKEEKLRWGVIKETFLKNNKLKGLGSDNQSAQFILQMEEITKGLYGIKEELKK